MHKYRALWSKVNKLSKYAVNINYFTNHLEMLGTQVQFMRLFVPYYKRMMFIVYWEMDAIIR